MHCIAMNTQRRPQSGSRSRASSPRNDGFSRSSSRYGKKRSDGDARPSREGDSKERPYQKRTRPSSGGGFGSRDGRPSRDGDSAERPYQKRTRPSSGGGFGSRDGRPSRDGDSAERPYQKRTRPSSGGGFGSRDGRPSRDAESKERSYQKRSRTNTGFGGRLRNAGSKGSSFHGRHSGRKGKKGFAEHINPALFIKKAAVVTIQEPAYEVTHKFADFKFAPQINKNLAHLKYEIPTPIQDQSIVHIQQGRDVIGLANTGTGKTGAFLLPLIDKLVQQRNATVLIIAPTRELALQIDNEFIQFARGTGLISALCIGGTSITKQMHRLKRRPHFVIGTPGRIRDLHERKALHLDRCKYVILDEVDRMMDMGFIIEITEILKNVPAERQSLFYSATMPPKIKKLAEEFLRDPVTVQVSVGTASETVDQDVVKVFDKSKKFEALTEILSRKEVEKTLIFCETKRETERIAVALRKANFAADSIHGDKSQFQRQKALSSFRDHKTTILVATDVAARGLDVKGITHVINYTIPQTYDDYVHRIGRAGRAGKKGFALTFI